MPRTSRVAIAAGVLVAAALAVVWSGPPATLTVPGAAPDTPRGAFHIHTTRSDGALPKAEVAAAAARAGLAFAVFTDHGDATRPPDPPEYLNGVLCLDGVEISTNDGHYVALDMPPAPYPLGGDAQAVAEDVRRLGGFGVAAHPGSPRDDLAWHDWAIPIDGLEWMNADTEWRDESALRLARSLLGYAWRPAGALAALLDRPDTTLGHWDSLASRRPVVGLAGHDAHGGIGAERNGGARGRRVHLPSYDAAFRAFSIYPGLDGRLSGDASADAGTVLRAIRSGNLFTAIEALAQPASLEFQGVAGETRVGAGGRLAAGRAVRFTARTAVPPSGATVRLLHNGVTVAENADGIVEYTGSAPGAYRVEVTLARPRDGVPWIVSNPIYVLPEPDATVRSAEHADATVLAAVPLIDAPVVEHAAGSAGELHREAGEVTLSFHLGSSPAESQFVALAVPIRLPAGADQLAFRASADRPMRVSVQLRFSTADARWGRSVYLDPSPREVVLALDDLRPADTQRSRPPLADATALLMVVDLTNARPGWTGEFSVGEVTFRRAGTSAEGGR